MELNRWNHISFIGTSLSFWSCAALEGVMEAARRCVPSVSGIDEDPRLRAAGRNPWTLEWIALPIEECS